MGASITFLLKLVDITFANKEVSLLGLPLAYFQVVAAMQTYILDLETLLSLLEEVGQSGTLSTELPTGLPGFKEYCWARVDLQEGKIVFCQIEGRHGRILASGRQALQLVSNLGSREWRLVEAPSLRPLSLSPVERSPRSQRSLPASSLVPQQVRLIDRSSLNRLPRRHRQVLSLIDGTRSIERIAALLHSSGDGQAIQQVEEIVQELKALGVITIET